MTGQRTPRDHLVTAGQINQAYQENVGIASDQDEAIQKERFRSLKSGAYTQKLKIMCHEKVKKY